MQDHALVVNADAATPATIGMFGNAFRGCCTCSTWAGVFVADAAENGQRLDFSDDAVLAMYRYSGWDGTDATDNGWSMVAAADCASRIGLVDTAGATHRSGPWMQINHTDIDEVMCALEYFGVLPTGVNLPKSAQNQEVWDTDGGGGDQEPGTWGGHSLGTVVLDRDGGYFRTWGGRKRFTRRFWNRYTDETIAKINPLLIKDGKTPRGFRLDQLVQAQGVLR